MSYTKRQFVEAAFSEIGYAAYVYDLQPEQLEEALRRLDAMMGTWYGKDIQVGYPIPTSPENSDLDEETDVPDAANEAVYTNLSLRVAPIVGKVPSMETKTTARRSYMELLGRATVPHEKQFPDTLPAGAGNKPWRKDNPFVEPPNENPIQVGDNGQLIFNGD
jgi:hypothetical protein